MTSAHNYQPMYSWSQSNDGGIDCYIENLYRAASDMEPREFLKWALGSLRDVVPFDAVLWARHCRWHYDFEILAKLRMSELTLASKEATLVQSVLANSTSNVDIDSAIPAYGFLVSQLFEMDLKVDANPAYGEQDSEPRHTLTLYRKASGSAFSDVDRRYQQQAAFHLLNAISHAQILHPPSTHLSQPAESALAVVNNVGTYDEVQPRFLEMLDSHFPYHDGTTLPFPLPTKGKVSVINGLCVRHQSQPGCSYIFIWPERALDRLTHRERQVLNAVVHGLSFKKTAQRIGISPSSAANHLYRIYTKLAVSNRSDLAKLVHADI